jgi:hypothetical protein
MFRPLIPSTGRAPLPNHHLAKPWSWSLSRLRP